MNQDTNVTNEIHQTDTLFEYLSSLKEKNNALINSCTKFSGLFKSKPICLFILNVSEKFKLNQEAKFLALELFAKFMNVHIREVEELIVKNPTRQMDDVYAKIKSQIILRSLSCIQLANKISSNNITITCEQIKDLLSDLGYNYSVVSITNSEMRVFKYLDYRLQISTPYVYLSAYTEAITRQIQQIDSLYLHSTNQIILEFFYCSRNQIYTRLYEALTGFSKDSNCDSLGILENDYIYLASSIIITSCYIKYASNKDFIDSIIEVVSKLSKYDKDDLVDFAEILCEFSLFNSNHNNSN